MNRMNSDGIIEWHRPLVSNNHGEKWRQNRSSGISAATATSAFEFVLGIFSEFSIEVPDRRLVALHERQENTHLLVRPDMTRGSRFLSWSNTNTATSAGEREREREREREKPSAQHPWWLPLVQQTESETRSWKKLLAHEKEFEKTALDRKSADRTWTGRSLENAEKFNALGMIRVNRIFQVFPAFFSILKINECALFKKFMLITLFNN